MVASPREQLPRHQYPSIFPSRSVNAARMTDSEEGEILQTPTDVQGCGTC